MFCFFVLCIQVCLHPMVSSFPLDKPWYLDQDEPVRRLVRGSPKLAVFLRLVTHACDEGHR